MGSHYTEGSPFLDDCRKMSCKACPSQPSGPEESCFRCDVTNQNHGISCNLDSHAWGGSPVAPGVSHTSTADTRFDKIGAFFPPTTDKCGACIPGSFEDAQASSYTAEVEQRVVPGFEEKEAELETCQESAARGIWYFAALETPRRESKRPLDCSEFPGEGSANGFDALPAKKPCVRDCGNAPEEQQQSLELSPPDNQRSCPFHNDDPQNEISCPCPSIEEDHFNAKKPSSSAWGGLDTSLGFLSPSSMHPLALDADELGLYWSDDEEYEDHSPYTPTAVRMNYPCDLDNEE